MNKKTYLFVLLILALTFTSKAIASFTLSSAAITGTTASTIDVGAGNALSLQTSNNGKVVTGSGFFGVGTITPVTELNVATSSASDPRGFMSAQYSTDTNGARIHFRKARGTEALPTSIVSGDTLGRLRFSGYDGSNYLQMGSIDVVSTGTIASTRVPTYMTFSTATDVAPSVLTERMRIDSAGNVGIGTASITKNFLVVGPASGQTQEGLSGLDPNSRTQFGVNNDASSFGTIEVYGSTQAGTLLGTLQTANSIWYKGAASGDAGAFVIVGSSTPTPLVLASNNLERIRIDTTGNVGIGQTTPGAKLDVKGHMASSQTTAPTTSVTGTGYSAGSLVTGSTDTKGAVTATVGANAGTVVVTFNSAYASAPICTVTPNTPTAQVDVVKMYATTGTGALTLNFVASPTGGSETWNYICLQ